MECLDWLRQAICWYRRAARFCWLAYHSREATKAHIILHGLVTWHLISPNDFESIILFPISLYKNTDFPLIISIFNQSFNVRYHHESFILENSHHWIYMWYSWRSCGLESDPFIHHPPSGFHNPLLESRSTHIQRFYNLPGMTRMEHTLECRCSPCSWLQLGWRPHWLDGQTISKPFVNFSHSR